MPLITVGLAGVTSMEASLAAVTVRIVEPVSEPDAAETEVSPTARLEARPFDPSALLMAATELVPVLQMTSVVIVRVEPSVYVPVAVNCCAVPRAMLGFTGEIPMETSAAPVTVSVVFPETLPDVAVIVVDPTAPEAARPFDPSVLLTVAIPVSEELHVTASVISRVVWSEKTPVAVNCWEVPRGMLGSAGDTSIETSAGPSSPPHPQPETTAANNNTKQYRKNRFFIPFSFPPY